MGTAAANAGEQLLLAETVDQSQGTAAGGVDEIERPGLGRGGAGQVGASRPAVRPTASSRSSAGQRPRPT